MTERNQDIPERLKGKLSPEAWKDSTLYYRTVFEMAHMGLKPPTWVEWIKDYSLLDLPKNANPDPLEETSL